MSKEWLKVGNTAVNVNQLVCVETDGGQVRLHFGGDPLRFGPRITGMDGLLAEIEGPEWDAIVTECHIRKSTLSAIQRDGSNVTLLFNNGARVALCNAGFISKWAAGLLAG